MRTRGNKLPEFSLHFKMRHAKKEPVGISAKKINDKQSEMLKKILRPVANISKPGQAAAKKGGKSRLELIPAFKLSDFPPQIEETAPKEDDLNDALEKDNESFYDSSEHSDYEVIYKLISFLFSPDIIA